MAFASGQKHFRSRIFEKLRECCYDGSLDETAPQVNPTQIDIDQVLFIINPDKDVIRVFMQRKVMINVNRIDLKKKYMAIDEG